MAKIEVSETLARELHMILDTYYENPIFDLSYDMVDFLCALKNISGSEGASSK